MGKLYNNLQKQLKIEEFKQDAEDCLKIYNKLKEIDNGHVWSSQWDPLITVFKWVGNGFYKRPIMRPSSIGYIFLKGIK